MKLLLKYPKAKSILCAYSIPRMPRFKHEEYSDDGETGWGRILMNVIKRNYLSNIAFFVVRKSKIGNIGASRFGLIKQALKDIMSSSPYNKFTNTRQFLEEDPTHQVPSTPRGSYTARDVCGKLPNKRGNLRGRPPVNKQQA